MNFQKLNKEVNDSHRTNLYFIQSYATAVSYIFSIFFYCKLFAESSNITSNFANRLSYIFIILQLECCLLQQFVEENLQMSFGVILTAENAV